MHSFVSFNGEILPSSQANLNPNTSAALYGNGVFSTIAICDSKPVFWEKHWRRLIHDSAILAIDISPFDQIELERQLIKLIERNGAKNARARITFFDESPSRLWDDGREKQTTVLLQTGERNEYTKRFRLMVSKCQVNSGSPLIGVKSCNYLDKLIAYNSAKSEGFDEAVRINERSEIVSGCMANIFWVLDNTVFTPPLETGCLAGTTREWVLENYKVIEMATSIAALSNADEIFLTSAGLGLQVAEINRTPETDEYSHPIYSKLKQMLDLRMSRN